MEKVGYFLLLIGSVFAGVIIGSPLFANLGPKSMTAIAIGTFFLGHGASIYLETGVFNPFRLPPADK